MLYKVLHTYYHSRSSQQPCKVHMVVAASHTGKHGLEGSRNLEWHSLNMVHWDLNTCLLNYNTMVAPDVPWSCPMKTMNYWVPTPWSLVHSSISKFSPNGVNWVGSVVATKTKNSGTRSHLCLASKEEAALRSPVCLWVFKQGMLAATHAVCRTWSEGLMLSPETCFPLSNIMALTTLLSFLPLIFCKVLYFIEHQ